MITPAHLAFHHGYTREHAAELSPEQREAEHQRLHDDVTARHLDHRHEDVVVMIDPDLAAVTAKIDAQTAQALATADDRDCVECGRDNRNGTHKALELTGHLSHAYDPKRREQAPRIPMHSDRTT